MSTPPKHAHVNSESTRDWIAGSPSLRRRSQSKHAVSWLAIACVVILSFGSATGVLASDKQKMRSLDEQVQEVKSDVLSIAAELSNLEEKLLFPSDTQVAVFVSLNGDASLQLDSAEIRIDGELVAAHIYSFKELEALKKGGVQRIHSGNVPTGKHQIEVVISGRQASGNEVTRKRQFDFTKEVGPKLIEISLAADRTGDGLITLGQR
jgi:archaellum component FlaG (FlaF/FlaG flagellin family)